MIRVLVLVIMISTGLAQAAGDPRAGKAAFEANCKTCHGATGQGNPAIAKVLKANIRDLSSPEVQARSDADLKKIVAEGNGKMKPVKSVSGKQAEDVIAFLRTLAKK